MPADGWGHVIGRRRAIRNGNKITRQGCYYRKHLIRVLLRRANDLRLGARGGLPLALGNIRKPTSTGWMASCGIWKVGFGDGPRLAIPILEHFEREAD